MNISTDLRLPLAEYLQETHPKDLIVLHHTVGGTAKSTFDYWRTDPRRVGTAYIVDRDGTIYEVFPSDRWCFHLGLKGARGRVDMRSIGIEIASEGALTYRDGKLYCFDVISPRTEFPKEKALDLGYIWRGYRYFDKYEMAQMDAVCELVSYLIQHFSIPAVTPVEHTTFNDRLRDFQGIIAHSHVRSDKSDVHPGFSWETLMTRCGLTTSPMPK